VLIGQDWQSEDSELARSVEDDAQKATMSKSDASTPDSDFMVAEVQFSEVRPETGQFEMIHYDSDEPTSSGSETPVPHRIRVIREDVQTSGTELSSSVRPGSRSPMKVVEVCDVKSSEASQWRKEVMAGAICIFSFILCFILTNNRCYFKVQWTVI